MQAQAAQVAQCHGCCFHIAHQRRFRDLQPQRVGAHTGLGERLGDDIVESCVDELADRHVHRNGDVGQRGHRCLPAPELRKGCAQHCAAELADQAGLFGHRQELVRTEQASIGVTPARQHFEPGELTGEQIDDRLVVRHDLTALQAMAQLARRAQRQDRGFMRARSERFDAVTTACLRSVHRCVGVPQELIGRHSNSVRKGDADAAGHEQLGSVDHQRFADCFTQSLGDVGR